MKKLIVSLWPNNQPPIVLGIFEKKTKLHAKVEAVIVNGMSAEDIDNMRVDVYTKKTVDAFSYWLGEEWEKRI